MVGAPVALEVPARPTALAAVSAPSHAVGKRPQPACQTPVDLYTQARHNDRRTDKRWNTTYSKDEVRRFDGVRVGENADTAARWLKDQLGDAAQQGGDLATLPRTDDRRRRQLIRRTWRDNTDLLLWNKRPPFPKRRRTDKRHDRKRLRHRMRDETTDEEMRDAVCLLLRNRLSDLA